LSIGRGPLNCYERLRVGGQLVFSVPNLASIYGRIELLMGFQPHVLEVSNSYANFGTGLFGRLNNPTNKPVHHVRGITYRAMREMVSYWGFVVERVVPYDYRLGRLCKAFVGVAPVNIFVCRKEC